MKTSLHLNRLTPVILFLVAMLPFSVRANYLNNTDYSQGLSCWEGDGDAAFLNPDGTEGAEGDKGVIPVIKIVLSKDEPRSVSQEYELQDDPKTEHIQVDVYASSDFKRSTYADDYSQNINWKADESYGLADEVIPTVDFWLRAGPGFFYKLADLVPGQWVTVDAYCDSPQPGTDRTVSFYAPPGDGTIYIRNASVTQ